MFTGNTCSSFGCGNVATEKCPDCELRFCSNHKFTHGHTKKMNVEPGGPTIWKGKPIATIYIPDEKTESFSDLLSFYHTALTDKIRALRLLNNMSSNMIDDYLASEKEKFKNKVIATLNEEEKKEYDIDVSLGVLSDSEYRISNPKIAKLFGEETEMYNLREYIRRPTKEMLLVYLIIVFEEFLNNMLSALFSKRRDVLMGSSGDKTISYKETLAYNDIDELVNKISKDASRDIVESNIEDLGYKLAKRFHLYLLGRYQN